MGTGGRYGKSGEYQRRENLRKSSRSKVTKPVAVKHVDHRKIAPKHPGMGRR